MKPQIRASDIPECFGKAEAAFRKKK